jgi:hypothetical protein
MKVKEVNLHCVERGPRNSALDKQLEDLCLEAGVKFEFGKNFASQHDFAQLPPDTIIATGLYPAGAFESFNIPYQKVFGYMGRGKTDDFPTCGVWMDDYILDYAYYGASNGVVFCLYFAREPVKESEFERFRDTQLEGKEGMHCSSWVYHEGLVPTACYDTPRLFEGDKILAGTLAGGMDPFALFGVHGSLVTGKIAAIRPQGQGRSVRPVQEVHQVLQPQPLPAQGVRRDARRHQEEDHGAAASVQPDTRGQAGLRDEQLLQGAPRIPGAAEVKRGGRLPVCACESRPRRRWRCADV